MEDQTTTPAAPPTTPPTAPPTARPRTKLVCTIGPASVDRARELVDAGMSVARVNISHGTPDTQKQAVHAVRGAAHHARRSVAVMVDLPGPKIRLGDLPEGTDSLELETNSTFELRTNRPTLHQEVQSGDRILLSDGAAELRVTGTSDDGAVQAEVVRGGIIRSRSGVNIPSERLTGDGLTDEDRAAIPRALELKADLVAQSFVRNAADVNALRALLPPDGPLIVAKIETRAGVDNFDEIADAADGVMVARGDLGVDIPFAEVPIVQKELIARARARDRFTIVATQMLESMTSAARPTRAEASDVANAVLDGTDAVMLSAETAIGAYPIEAARAMIEICATTENGAPITATAAPNPHNPWLPPTPPTDDQAAICRAAVAVADAYPPASAIWCFTRTGRTGQLLSHLQPRVPVIAFTLNAIVARRLAIRRAIVPVVLGQAQAQQAGQPLIERMAHAARAQRLIGQPGDTVVFVTTSAQAGGVNRLELAEV